MLASARLAPAAPATKPAAPATQPAKPIPASRGYTFEFTDEKKIRELWTLPDDPKTWQAVNGGLNLHRGVSSFQGRFTWAGDAAIQLAVTGHDFFGPPTVASARGHRGCLNPAGDHRLR